MNTGAPLVIVMPAGTIVAIHLNPEGSTSVDTVREVQAVAGRGLEGDRNFLKPGSSEVQGHPAKPEQQLTLIESEAVEAARREYSIGIEAREVRRNIVTRGVPLNHLVGREFSVGPVRVRAVRLCEPCEHMEKLSGVSGARKALVHRGGLRAEILTDGVIRVGDPVAWEE